MKILNSAQLREADLVTLAKQQISSADLMERAAKACSEWLLELPRLKSKQKVCIFSGLGNNGGDGLAIARLLSERKVEVQLCIVHYANKTSEDFKANEKRIAVGNSIRRVDIYTENDLESVDLKEATVIDAIFGSGLNRPVEGLAAAVIGYINRNSGCTVSIDVPSGLNAEPGNTTNSPCIKAFHTLTFQAPRLIFMFPEYFRFLGDFTVLDIGLDHSFIKSQESVNFFITPDKIRSLLRPRTKFSNKGSYGHGLLIAGSYGKMGAALLAAQACLKSGAGLLTIHLPACGYEILQTEAPEALVIADPGFGSVGTLPDLSAFSSVGIGPGIGTDNQTQSLLKLLIQNVKCPLVLDADALNILSENKTWLSFLPAGSILTPHPKEFERLAGKSENDYERYGRIRDFAFKFNVYLVLKGAHTAIACPDGRVYFNSTGNPGMAKGGTGDVLTGLLTGLLAQGYPAKDASLLGIYWHGLAGDIASGIHTEQAMTAQDIPENLGKAYKILLG